MLRNDLHKLNTAQRAKLRAMFSGRVARLVVVDDITDSITVEFDKSTHFLAIGPRGGLNYHNIISNRVAGA